MHIGGWDELDAHNGTVTGLVWAMLGNAHVALQGAKDGTHVGCYLQGILAIRAILSLRAVGTSPSV